MNHQKSLQVVSPPPWFVRIYPLTWLGLSILFYISLNFAPSPFQIALTFNTSHSSFLHSMSFLFTFLNLLLIVSLFTFLETFFFFFRSFFYCCFPSIWQSCGYFLFCWSLINRNPNPTHGSKYQIFVFYGAGIAGILVSCKSGINTFWDMYH